MKLHSSVLVHNTYRWHFHKLPYFSTDEKIQTVFNIQTLNEQYFESFKGLGISLTYNGVSLQFAPVMRAERYNQ